MPNDPLTQYTFLTSLGMNNRWNELDFNGEWVLLAQNCRFATQPGSVIKRQPLAYYNNTTMSTSQGVVGLYRYYSTSGPLLIAVVGSTVYVGNDSTGAMTAIRTLSTTGQRMMFVTYNDLLIGSNGQDPIWVYDGDTTNFITWGLGSCKAVTGTSTGITATSVSYAITMDTNAFIPAAISNTIATLANQSVNLSFIPLGPAGTTDRTIYRKDSGTSGAYKKVATISDNSTTTYTDNTASGNLTTTMGATTDPIPQGAWVLIFGERLFITADPNNLNRIYYSEPFLPNFIQQNTNLDYLDVAKDDGDQIQGIVVQNGTMVCIKQNNMRKLNITTAESNADPASWSAEEPFAQVGTPARYSIVQTPFGVVLLNWDAWYLYDGGSLPKPIILQFDTRQILPANYNAVVTAYNDGMLFASYTSIASGQQFPTQVMVYDMKLTQMGVDTYSAGAFASATGINEVGDLYIGDATQGFVYKAEEGNVFWTLSNLSQAEQGTTADTFIGGSQNNPFIQIGAEVSPQAIPTGVCLFWDQTSNPGPGWTEIIGYSYTYPIISTYSGSMGGSSLHSHTLTGTSSQNVGPIGNCGNANNQANGLAHSHSVSGSSDPMFANPSYFGLRIFYKNSSTTEYSFPVGSILMWDQQTAPDNWITYNPSTNGYLRINSPAASAANWVVGTAYTVGQYVTATDPFSGMETIYYCQIAHTSGAYDNAFNARIGFTGPSLNSQPISPEIPAAGVGGTGTYPISPPTFADDLAAGFWVADYNNLGITTADSHSHPYGVVSTFQTGPSPVTNNISDSGNLGPLNAHTHYIVGVTNATNTGGNAPWELDRIEVTFIKKLIADEIPWDGTDKNVLALFWDTSGYSAASNGWTDISSTVIAYSSTTAYIPGNLVTYGSDSNTVALFHFDNSLNDSSTNNLTAVSFYYVFVVAGITTWPTPGATYTNNGSRFKVSTSTGTGTAGTIIMFNDLTGAPSATGTLAKQAGTGDASITFYSWTQTAYWPTFSSSISKFGLSAQFDGTGLHGYNFTAVMLNNTTTVYSGLWASGTPFTIDFWSYITAQPLGGQYTFFGHGQDSNSDYISLDYYDSGGGVYNLTFTATSQWASSVYTLTLNTWNHIAYVKDSGDNITIYVNGVPIGTQAITQHLPSAASLNNYNPTIGAWAIAYIGASYGFVTFAETYTGYLDEFRISNIARWIAGFTPTTSAYTTDTYTKLLLHLENNVTDSETTPKIVTNNGVTFSNAVHKVGSYSGNFNGSSYLSITTSPDFNFSGDFTVDFWVYPNSFVNDPTMIANENEAGGSAGWGIEFDTHGHVNFSAMTRSIELTTTTTVSTGAWTHIAVIRYQGQVTICINGVNSAQATYTGTISTTNNLFIGTDAGVFYFLNGYLDEIRISNGIARWPIVSSFIPPTGPYQIGNYYKSIQAGTGFEPDISSSYWANASAPQLYIKSVPNYLVGQANNGYTHNHGNTPAITTSYPLQFWCNGGYLATTGLMHQHTLSCSTSNVAIPNPQWLTFRLWSKLLGKMTTYNDAATNQYTNGLYYSPALQLNVQKFGQVFFNPNKLPTDSINIYFQTAATAAALTTGQTVTITSNAFNLNANGFSNGQRVSFKATTMATGLSANIMYYVVNVMTNSFQVSLTLSGPPVSCSGGTALAVLTWTSEISISDTNITATPGAWVAFVVEFIAANTVVSNPTLVTDDGYLIKFSYSRSGTIAETSVEWIYSTGRMNAKEPAIDKIYKRIASAHTTTAGGQVLITWLTENATNTWTVDLNVYPNKWASYFHDMAMGEVLTITYYKNDLLDFDLRQFTIQYSPQPMLV